MRLNSDRISRYRALRRPSYVRYVKGPALFLYFLYDVFVARFSGPRTIFKVRCHSVFLGALCSTVVRNVEERAAGIEKKKKKKERDEAGMVGNAFVTKKQPSGCRLYRRWQVYGDLPKLCHTIRFAYEGRGSHWMGGVGVSGAWHDMRAVVLSHKYCYLNRNAKPL